MFATWGIPIIFYFIIVVPIMFFLSQFITRLTGRKKLSGSSPWQIILTAVCTVAITLVCDKTSPESGWLAIGICTIASVIDIFLQLCVGEKVSPN